MSPETSGSHSTLGGSLNLLPIYHASSDQRPGNTSAQINSTSTLGKMVANSRSANSVLGDSVVDFGTPQSSNPGTPESTALGHEERRYSNNERDGSVDHNSAITNMTSSRLFNSPENGNMDKKIAVQLNSQGGEVESKLEKKRIEHERQRIEQRKKFEEQMKLLELQHIREEQDLLQQRHPRSSNEINSVRSRFPTSSVLSSLALSSTQFISPTVIAPAEQPRSTSRISNTSRSLPASRRNSSDTDDWPDVAGLSLNPRVDRIDRSKEADMPIQHIPQGPSLLQKALSRSAATSDEALASTAFGADNTMFTPHFNDKFLFDDEEGSPDLSSSFVRRYLDLTAEDDETFPTLVRRDSFPGMLSASSAALDLASLSQKSSARQHRHIDGLRNPEWPQLSSSKIAGGAPDRQLHSRVQLGQQSLFPSNGKKPTSSLSTVSFSSKNADSLSSDGIPVKVPIPKLTPSYSNPELSTTTRLTTAGLGAQFNDMDEPSAIGFANSFAGNPLANPATTRGLIPNMAAVAQMGYPTALPFNSTTANMYGPMNINPLNTMYNPANQGFGYSSVNSAALHASNMLRQVQHQGNLGSTNMNGKNSVHNKRVNDPEANRFAGVRLEELVGEIYSLCKDQHGCRYLQKKLEEQNESYLNIIFAEVFGHFVELMTDPFGNYLCQKLLEYCNDDQRTVIVETVAPELVNISLNMHGTRAVQKMIEFLSTSKQIRMVVVSLNPNVVTLIKDLNGNHVIQKCLNRLTSEDNQFIYNAVSQHCIEVATHRHGCCVLQRCIDHASDTQKMQLVNEITFNALTLVQDPFGNYVVQYVLDLGDARFSDGLIRRFIGSVCVLSVQKFSSNVMEKCIRAAEPDTRRLLIEEMLNKPRLDKMLRDSYANYVVQTCLDYADPTQRVQLVECIRPLLPAIRNTPYGKRIQGKLHRDQQMGLTANMSLSHNGMASMASMNGVNSVNGVNVMGFGFNGVNGFSNMGMIGLNEYPGYPSYM